MVSNNSVNFKLKTAIYPLTAIYTAAYVFLGKTYVYLDNGVKGEVVVQLKGKGPLTTKEKEALKGEFNNELLNCALRESIAKENAKIREYIVGQALYSSVQDTALPAAEDSLDDPLGIAVPWEEKYGSKAKKAGLKKAKRASAKVGAGKARK